MRCIMMLASGFGLNCFDVVEKINEVEVVGVITPKEKYKLKYGEGCIKEMENLIFHSLVIKCQKKDIPFFVMEKMNSLETIQQIIEWNPELIIVSGWYHMIGKKILDIPSKGVIGLHSSMLPRYRGGAPLVWQMINGEKTAGISLFYMDVGVDSGDIVAQTPIPIEEYDTIGTLYAKVNREGIKLLKDNLPLIAEGKSLRVKQVGLSDNEIYPQRSPQDGIINWTNTGRQIYNFVRAQTKPYPGAYTYYSEYKIVIWKCMIIHNKYLSGEPGVIADIKIEHGKCEPIALTGDSECAIHIKEFLVLNENGQAVEAGNDLFRVNEFFRDNIRYGKRN